MRQHSARSCSLSDCAAGSDLQGGRWQRGADGTLGDGHASDGRAGGAAAVALGVAASADPVDDYVRSQLASRRLPGVALAVVKDGRVVKTAGYGVASLESSVPVSPDTVSEIGSIQQAVRRQRDPVLVEDGKVTLDDPISTYLARTPPAWSAITIRHILTHTSGLADFDSGDIGFSYRREYTADEFVELLGKQPLAFPPGERWNYTNAFPLLGMVVERASGMPYTEFVRARIFAPLGLRSARFKSASEVVPHRADGYLFKDGPYQHGEPLRPQIIAPNGGILINVLGLRRVGHRDHQPPVAATRQRRGHDDAGAARRWAHRRPRAGLVPRYLQRPPLRRALGHDRDRPLGGHPPLCRRPGHRDHAGQSRRWRRGD